MTAKILEICVSSLAPGERTELFFKRPPSVELCDRLVGRGFVLSQPLSDRTALAVVRPS
jgi:hypothetical protein